MVKYFEMPSQYFQYLKKKILPASSVSVDSKLFIMVDTTSHCRKVSWPEDDVQPNYTKLHVLAMIQDLWYTMGCN
jgi:hypothetical protein